MSGNDYKSQLAAERMKAQALLVAKGLSRTQAERAAAAAARNVNAYGQKEEGPSRWQERKEAKRQMYLGSTEKPPILGVKPKASPTSSGGAYSQCQKCFQLGHWTYECKNDHTYISRPSRTQQIKNPKLKKTTLLESCQFVNPDLEKEREEERRLLKEKIEKGKSERREAKRRRKHLSRSGSDHNSSEASVFNTDTESSATGSEYSSERGSSSCSSSDSEGKKRRHKRKLKKRRHRRSSTSSGSSDSESTSDSDSDDKGGRRKSRRRGNKH
ncbi:zinc finger CCHC domain-containing protein 10-like [Lolium rigidum]|uniref:zinc finger CCHC domain-containing protein 10-like n=1 Tax=Lolium rigidum TaxID=89674 RepID=UPI001F5E2464|nr:zinc finger CCHC domain-containing protein 10-like [Lolium rigidum]